MTKQHILLSIVSFAFMLLGFTILMTLSDTVSLYPHFWDGKSTQVGFGIFLLALGTLLFLSIPDSVRTPESSLRKLKFLCRTAVVFGACITLYGISSTLGV